QLERELSSWLVAAERLGVAQRCGMASLFEYADRHLGLSHGQTEERLRVGKALAALPSLDRAFAQGTLTFSHVRELSRVATGDTEQAWLDWTLSRAVDGTDENDVTTRRRLREVEQAVARRALGAARTQDEGRAPYQVAVSKCADCGQTRVDAAGQSHPVDEAFAATADCDAQRLGAVDARPHVGEPPGPPNRATQTIPPATRRRVLRRDHERCVVPGCQNHRFLDLHHVTPRSEGGTHDPDQLVSLCGAHHRAAHTGTLVLEGTASQGFTFRHADGSPYGVAAVQVQGAPTDVETFLRLALTDRSSREPATRLTSRGTARR
ncbi:MAG: HNH endonuclease signature motif containing protein, partial [Polyangiaceae bacterium]